MAAAFHHEPDTQASERMFDNVPSCRVLRHNQLHRTCTSTCEGQKLMSRLSGCLLQGGSTLVTMQPKRKKLRLCGTINPAVYKRPLFCSSHQKTLCSSFLQCQ